MKTRSEPRPSGSMDHRSGEYTLVDPFTRNATRASGLERDGYLEAKRNRIRMLPRSGRRQFVARPATIPAGASQLTLKDAETFLRVRWIGNHTSPATIEGAFDLAFLQNFLKGISDSNGI